MKVTDVVAPQREVAFTITVWVAQLVGHFVVSKQSAATLLKVQVAAAIPPPLSVGVKASTAAAARLNLNAGAKAVEAVQASVMLSVE